MAKVVGLVYAYLGSLGWKCMWQQLYLYLPWLLCFLSKNRNILICYCTIQGDKKHYTNVNRSLDWTCQEAKVSKVNRQSPNLGYFKQCIWPMWVCIRIHLLCENISNMLLSCFCFFLGPLNITAIHRKKHKYF
jgi:hypothetical protein